jgi:hypothetical protein
MSSIAHLARIELLEEMMNRGLFIWQAEKWHVQKSPTAADMKMTINDEICPSNHMRDFDTYEEAFDWCIRYCRENPLST